MSHFTQLSFVLAVGQDLVPTEVFLLHCPHALFISLLLFHHFGLSHLHFSLVHDLRSLVGVHALEMIRLDAMGRQHRLLRGRVLRHKVVRACEVHIALRLQLLVGALSVIPIAFLFGQLQVGVLHRALHVRTRGRVLILRIGEKPVEVQRLIVMDLVSESLLLLVELTLADLLLDPVPLL